MTHQPPLPQTVVDMVQEAHLRLAVLLDLIDDEMAVGLSVAPRLAQLRMEYDRHALGQEQVLSLHLPHLLDQHRRGHDRMRALLARMSTEYASGGDIRPIRDQVLALFTDRLMPDDLVFKGMMSAAPPPSVRL